LVLACFYGLWVIAFHVPSTVMNAIGSIGAWNAPAESAFVTSGALALLAAHASSRSTLALAARLLAGASAVVFGFAHFNYIDFTASMVPAWIPAKTFWAWATGAGHLLTGLALLSGIRARLAATCEAAMMGSFVVLLHLPRVIASPDQHVEWIMLAMSSALTGAALLVRKYATIEA
ncbi:MAG TPA: DoxX family membrane protein, partial [Steroidobacteraceae bacterium]